MSLSLGLVKRTPFLQGQTHFLSTGLPALLPCRRLGALRSARALTTMAADSYKYVVLGGGNASG